MTGPRHQPQPRAPRPLGWLVPLATAFAALAADLLPLPPAVAGAAPAPLFTLCLVHAWTLHAPESFPAPAVFATGLVLDGVAGAPLGSASLGLLLVRAGVLVARRSLLGAPPLAAWAAFAVVALAWAAVRWLVAAAWWGHLFPPRPALAEAFLTFAAYPLVGWPIARLQQLPARSGARRAAGT